MSPLDDEIHDFSPKIIVNILYRNSRKLSRHNMCSLEEKTRLQLNKDPYKRFKLILIQVSLEGFS